jgi:hypothetical protein
MDKNYYDFVLGVDLDQLRSNLVNEQRALEMHLFHFKRYGNESYTDEEIELIRGRRQYVCDCLAYIKTLMRGDDVHKNF